MDDNLYDEFGVYIGPDLDDDEVQSEQEETAFDAEQRGNNFGQDHMDIGAYLWRLFFSLLLERCSIYTVLVRYN